MRSSVTAVRTLLSGRAELALAVGLAALGGITLHESTTLSTNAADRGPISSATMPMVVGLLLLVVGVLLFVDVLRGGRGEMDGGEDIDLDQPPAWIPFVAIAAAFLVNAMLMETVGWPITGGFLFWATATALGSRSPMRDAAISFAMSVGSYLLFVNVMGIFLPAGFMEGVI